MEYTETVFRKSQLQVRIPQNLKVEFAIPDKLTESDDIIYRNRSIGAHQGIMEEFLLITGGVMVIFYRFIYGVLSDKCCTGSQSVCVYAKNKSGSQMDIFRDCHCDCICRHYRFVNVWHHRRFAEGIYPDGNSVCGKKCLLQCSLLPIC